MFENIERNYEKLKKDIKLSWINKYYYFCGNNNNVLWMVREQRNI